MHSEEIDCFSLTLVLYKYIIFIKIYNIYLNYIKIYINHVM